MTKKILMVVTNADQLDKEHQTGLWLSEFVEPATELKEAGFEVVAASMEGGKIPIDPNSYSNELPRVWDGVMEPIHDTEKLSDLNPSDFVGIFFCGGHGSMVDFPNNETIQQILRHFISERKIIASVCHGPAAFVGVTDHNEKAFVKGRTMTGFTNEEEKQTGLEPLMPFLLEDQLKEEGADFIVHDAFTDHVEVDENLVTGQNHHSSLRTAQAMIKQLKDH
ncbi:type 1 glutamine amidotransferase domain-containing protein [Halobacillus locisalis]|uniref:Type 1 glutamine amidotransferase domain-containing protein n=1 Tax=Halobacillus locisalis TaxID=220753 RepID=A0A838CTQ1_9BACI|nr:type 1 glutamine amidotransferase domain-containing protein [Halobacillus locisalis]MBA2175189.1 type 1 glutamine amidotransferase domain-containing protein [Halobacillus locisalis]